MNLTRATIVEESRAYEETEPFYEVERDQLASLPDAFEDGPLLWRDVDWIIRWYYRRDLEALPHHRRQTKEDQFGENDWEDVQTAVDRAVKTDDSREQVESLLALKGVDVPVASAVLQFAAPDRHLVLDEGVWDVLHRAGELDAAYPTAPTVGDYLAYRDRCLAVAEDRDVDLQTLYRALWRLAEERTDG